MIHIVFQHADVAVLKKAIELDATLDGLILEIRDDFAVGPVLDLDTEEGWTARQNWWKELLDQSPYASDNLVGSFDDRNTVHQIKQILNEDKKEEVWIWMGQNQHDVCGYYWLIGQLKEYSGRVVVLYFNNLPFINEKGHIFYPTTLHQIQPKEFLKAKKLNRKVTLSEFEVDPDEWKRLANENAMVRILEGGKKIVGKDGSYYDHDVLAGLSPEWQKGNRAIYSILTKMKIKTGDVFLLWRLRLLAAAGKVDVNGETSKGWKDFEVKLKSAGPAEVVTESADANLQG
jgi:hypothetical protein